MTKVEKKMVRSFLTPPRIGRQFVTTDKHARYTWTIEQIIRKMSQADYRYEILASLVYQEKLK